MRVGTSVRRLLLSFLALALLFPLFASAATPHLIYLQGKLTFKANGSNAGSVVVNVTAWLSAAGGSEVPGYAGGENTTTTANGTFDLLLGSTKVLNLDYNRAYYLEVRAGGEVVDLAPADATTNRSRFIASGGPANASELNYTANTTIEEQLFLLTPDPDLLFLAHFNNNTLSTTGEAPNATGSISFEAGRFGKALNLSGSSFLSYFGPSVAGVPGLTVAAWISLRAHHPTAGSTILGKWGTTSTSDAFLFRTEDSGQRLEFRVDTDGVEGGTTAVFSTSNISTGVLTHVAGVWNGTTLQIYVNGVLQSSTAFAGPLFASTAPLMVGATNEGTYGLFNGTIDEAAVWGRALTPAEVGALASSSQLASGEPFDLVRALGLQAGTCGSGFVDAGDYCIDRNERPAQTWTDAINTCTLAGARLCGESEFIGACSIASSIGMQNPINNQEWVDDATDAGAVVRGDGSCLGGGAISAASLRNFRCCKNKPSVVGGFGGPVNVLSAPVAGTFATTSTSFVPVPSVVVNFTTATTSKVLLTYHGTVTVQAGETAETKLELDGAQLAPTGTTHHGTGGVSIAVSNVLPVWVTVGPGSHAVRVLIRSVTGATVDVQDNLLTAAIFPETSLGGAIGGARFAHVVGTTDCSPFACPVPAAAADVPDMSATIESLGGPVFIVGSVNWFNSGSTTTVGNLLLSIDGVDLAGTTRNVNVVGPSIVQTQTLHHATALTPGTHTIKLRWHESSQDSLFGYAGSQRWLSVLAVKPA